jgi:hypothetical protein
MLREPPPLSFTTTTHSDLAGQTQCSSRYSIDPAYTCRYGPRPCRYRLPTSVAAKAVLCRAIPPFPALTLNADTEATHPPIPILYEYTPPRRRNVTTSNPPHTYIT